MDNKTSIERSSLMSKVRRQNTKPEITVRSILHKLGYRFRLHDKKLPGTPDIVLPKYNTVIFVHGCFWHQHEGCRKSRRPTSNINFWNEKLDKNIKRDNEKAQALQDLGWKVLTVWECELKAVEVLSNRLFNEMQKDKSVIKIPK